MSNFFLKPMRWAFFQGFGRAKGEVLYSRFSGPLGDWIKQHTPIQVQLALDAITGLSEAAEVPAFRTKEEAQTFVARHSIDDTELLYNACRLALGIDEIKRNTKP